MVHFQKSVEFQSFRFIGGGGGNKKGKSQFVIVRVGKCPVRNIRFRLREDVCTFYKYVRSWIYIFVDHSPQRNDQPS